MTEYFDDWRTVSRLKKTIREYNEGRFKINKVILKPKEFDTLVEKINSIMRNLVVQKITPDKVKEIGKFIKMAPNKLPMDFIKGNHVYYPTGFVSTSRDALIVGVEVISPMGQKHISIGEVKHWSEGVMCYFIYNYKKSKSNFYPRIVFSRIKANGWGWRESGGTYVLNLDKLDMPFLNWDNNPFEVKQ